jgi:hypothetical protein
MHPTQIKNPVDLAHQMVAWDYLVEIKRIQKLDLTILPPTHYASLPLMSLSNQRNHGSRVVSIGVLQHNRGYSGRHLLALSFSAFDPTRKWELRRDKRTFAVEAMW